MNKLKFSQDKGSNFYKELIEKTDQYFSENKIPKVGNKIMVFKIVLYFGLDVLFYSLMITSTTTLGFYAYYLLMGLSILLTAFNISHDAAHGVAVKSGFGTNFYFQLVSIFKETMHTSGGKTIMNRITFIQTLKEVISTYLIIL